MKKAILLLVIVLLILPLSINSQQTVTKEQKLQETLVDMTIMFNETKKVNEKLSVSINALIEDLKKIENPQPELIEIFKKYQIPYKAE
ncbi:hypothetical protein H8E88_05125 [candidate division KSB1 bacterium]|nr:hypothetical protein [candidate division KSB1 bacterium]